MSDGHRPIVKSFNSVNRSVEMVLIVVPDDLVTEEPSRRVVIPYIGKSLSIHIGKEAEGKVTIPLEWSGEQAIIVQDFRFLDWKQKESRRRSSAVRLEVQANGRDQSLRPDCHGLETLEDRWSTAMPTRRSWWRFHETTPY